MQLIFSLLIPQLLEKHSQWEGINNNWICDIYRQPNALNNE